MVDVFWADKTKPVPISGSVCSFFSSLVAVVLVTLVLFAGGCSFPAQEKPKIPPQTSEQKALEEYAKQCYARALTYMSQSRYELARQQFSFAASSAVSRGLYEDAVAGLRRADQIIHERR